MAPVENDAPEPLPLESGGIKHGDTFADLVTGRSVHGRLQLAATWADETSELSWSATLQDVVAPPRPSARQISDWQLDSGTDQLALHKTGFDDRSDYNISFSGTAQFHRQFRWRGLIPGKSNKLAAWVETRLDALQEWALGVRHLQCPRRLAHLPFITPESAPATLGPVGEHAPEMLAASDELRQSVQQWYRTAFRQTLEIIAQGTYSQLMARAPAHGGNVPLTQSGRGLSQVLPVVVMALTARDAGPGVDVIEHPEAELHPAAHAHVADLLLRNLAGRMRPLLVETHSEMLLLRARRWVAERRLPSDNVIVYWIQTEPMTGSTLRRIRISDDGELDDWPDGVFIEDYEEILAIRRAALARQ